MRDFPGKSRKQQEIEFSDRKTANVIRQCSEIAGQYLFCYRTDDGVLQPIRSTDVNTYLREISGEPISAKDFRTWWGSVAALAELAECESHGESNGEAAVTVISKRAISQAVREAAQTLGNTMAVCRQSYIHPGILQAAEAGTLCPLIEKVNQRLRPTAELNRWEGLLLNLLPLL